MNRVCRLMSVAPGAVLCREDDAPGQAYLVVSGSLRVYRRDRKNSQQNQELAELGPGSIVGELSAVLNQPRTATVQAATTAQVLAIPSEQLRDMAQTHSPLLRVLILALQERAGMSSAEISALGAALGVDLSSVSEFLEASEASEPSGDTRESDPDVWLAAPHDAAVVDTRRAKCPACRTIFTALVYRSHMMRPTETESDFHQHFSTAANPYDYEVWVCPNDLYAALPGDFTELGELSAADVLSVVSSLVTTRWNGARPDFTADRNLLLRERSLELALELYRLREVPPARVASVLHRLAWCARERGDAEAEQRWLREALNTYEEAYALGAPDDPKEDLRLQYLCGELARRLDDRATAVRWFQQLLAHPKVKQFPRWERLTRQQWSQLRERQVLSP